VTGKLLDGVETEAFDAWDTSSATDYVASVYEAGGGWNAS
jgi:hypothetical protein